MRARSSSARRRAPSARSSTPGGPRTHHRARARLHRDTPVAVEVADDRASRPSSTGATAVTTAPAGAPMRDRMSAGSADGGSRVPRILRPRGAQDRPRRVAHQRRRRPTRRSPPRGPGGPRRASLVRLRGWPNLDPCPLPTELKPGSSGAARRWSWGPRSLQGSAMPRRAPGRLAGRRQIGRRGDRPGDGPLDGHALAPVDELERGVRRGRGCSGPRAGAPRRTAAGPGT